MTATNMPRLTHVPTNVLGYPQRRVLRGPKRLCAYLVSICTELGGRSYMHSAGVGSLALASSCSPAPPSSPPVHCPPPLLPAAGTRGAVEPRQHGCAAPAAVDAGLRAAAGQPRQPYGAKAHCAGRVGVRPPRPTPTLCQAVLSPTPRGAAAAAQVRTCGACGCGMVRKPACSYQGRCPACLPVPPFPPPRAVQPQNTPPLIPHAYERHMLVVCRQLSPEALAALPTGRAAQLVAGLAGLEYRPSTRWVARFCKDTGACAHVGRPWEAYIPVQPLWPCASTHCITLSVCVCSSQVHCCKSSRYRNWRCWCTA